jgi:hypothetical protein
VAEEVEGRPLAGEEGAQRPGHRADPLPGVEPVAVGGRPGHRDRRVELGEDLGGGGRTGQHAGAAGDEVPGADGIGGDESGRGEVAEDAEVLGQGPGHGLLHGADGRVEVARHRRVSSSPQGD